MPPFAPLPLRPEVPPSTLVLIRFGAQTLSDERLHETCIDMHETYGLFGFSVNGLDHDDWAMLAREVPILRRRRKVLTAQSEVVLAAGFPVLPTLKHPHWSVVVSRPTSEQFGRVRDAFGEPIDNPTFDRDA